MTVGPGHPQRERLLELLADRAVQGLSAAESAELERLLDAIPGARAEADAFDLAAAAADLAMMDQPSSMPESLRSSLAAQASSWSAAQPAARAAFNPDIIATLAARAPARSPWPARTGWLAAAACLTLAVIGWFGRGPNSPPPPIDPAVARSSLLAAARDIKQWNWTALGELEKSAVTGDTVWSNATQQGFMTFAGLPVNDPTVEQYQLWIFDPAQSDQTPIDGGVFNVSASGTVTVAIDPKIRVTDATMFAITIEKPGGVVVSDRSRLVLIAKPG